jgi:hypothetical protein
MLSWPIPLWVQQRTSIDVPPEFEKPMKTFSIG